MHAIRVVAFMVTLLPDVARELRQDYMHARTT